MLYKLTLFTVVLLLLFTSLQCTPSEDRLIRRMLIGYQTSSRPVLRNNNTVNVNMSVTLKRLVDMDENKEVLQTQLQLFFEWCDYRLVWNSTEYEGLNHILLNRDRIWTPDIKLTNGADEALDPQWNFQVKVTSAGNVIWTPIGHFKSTCRLDITWFPFDVQMCEVKFASWANDVTSLNITVNSDSLHQSNTTVIDSEWIIYSQPIRSELQYHDGASQPIAVVRYRLTLTRIYATYLFEFVLPVSILTCLSALTFCLPPGSGEKITLGSAMLVAMSFYSFIGTNKIPHSSSTIPLITVYYTGVMTTCAVTILLSVLVLKLHDRSTVTYPMPSKLRAVCRGAAIVLCISQPHQHAPSPPPQSPSDGSLQADDIKWTHIRSSFSSSSKAGRKMKMKEDAFDWRLAACVVDRACCIFFILTVICISATFIIAFTLA